MPLFTSTTSVQIACLSLETLIFWSPYFEV